MLWIFGSGPNGMAHITLPLLGCCRENPLLCLRCILASFGMIGIFLPCTVFDAVRLPVHSPFTFVFLSASAEAYHFSISWSLCRQQDTAPLIPAGNHHRCNLCAACILFARWCAKVKRGRRHSDSLSVQQTICRSNTKDEQKSSHITETAMLVSLLLLALCSSVGIFSQKPPVPIDGSVCNGFRNGDLFQSRLWHFG